MDSWKLKMYRRRAYSIEACIAHIEADLAFDPQMPEQLRSHLRRVADRAESRLAKIQMRIKELEEQA